ncbi:hypothetical protein [Carbonactinospora thermoautotrophica]
MGRLFRHSDDTRPGRYDVAAGHLLSAGSGKTETATIAEITS